MATKRTLSAGFSARARAAMRSPAQDAQVRSDEMQDRVVQEIDAILERISTKMDHELVAMDALLERISRTAA